MKLPKVVLSSAVFLLVLSGCSNDASDDREPSRNAPNLSAVKLTPFNELGRFNGVPPSDLMKDEIIGKEIRAIVPRTAFACMDNVFNYMRDLELGKDGALSATMNGSHADNFMEASVTVKPSGALTIVLQCVTEAEQTSSPKKYQIFTNGDIRSVDPATISGIYDANPSDIVLITNGKEKIESPFEAFEEIRVAVDVTGEGAAASAQSASTDKPAQSSNPPRQSGGNQSNEDIKMVSWSTVDCGKRLPCFEGVVQNDSNSTPAFIYARFAVFDAQNNQLGILEPRIDSLSPGARGKFKVTTYYPEMSTMKFIGFKVTP